MDAGVAMNEGWVCGECTAADEADAAGEEDEHDAPGATVPESLRAGPPRRVSNRGSAKVRFSRMGRECA